MTHERSTSDWLTTLGTAAALLFLPAAFTAAVQGEPDDLCCEATQCEGGETQCATIHTPGGNEIDCYKGGDVPCDDDEGGGGSAN